VQGFSDTINMESLPVVTVVTAVDIDSTTYLVVVNEGIYVRGNKTSLLSTFQARSHDITKIHGGKQCLVVDEMQVPLEVKNGLLVCGCRGPTDTEMKQCIRLVLTSDMQWDVTDETKSKYDDKENLFAHGDFEGTYTVSVNPSKSVPEIQDPQEFQAKLAWMPLPIIERTLKCTTQLAKNHLRLPLRQHNNHDSIN